MSIKNARSLHRFVLASASAGALAVGLLGLGGAAQASTISSTQPAAPQQVCSVDSGTQTAVCVPLGQDLNAAVLRKTGKLVVVPDGAVGTKLSTAVAPAGAQATYIQSQMFSYSNYGGSMILQITNSSNCNGTTTWQLTNFAAYGADNDTDSFKSYGTCSTKIWDNSNLTGTSYGYQVNAPYVGNAMVNRASSAQIH
jgi:hypothetical protein